MDKLLFFLPIIIGTGVISTVIVYRSLSSNSNVNSVLSTVNSTNLTAIANLGAASPIVYINLSQPSQATSRVNGSKNANNKKIYNNSAIIQTGGSQTDGGTNGILNKEYVSQFNGSFSLSENHQVGNDVLSLPSSSQVDGNANGNNKSNYVPGADGEGLKSNINYQQSISKGINIPVPASSSKTDVSKRNVTENASSNNGQGSQGIESSSISINQQEANNNLPPDLSTEVSGSENTHSSRISNNIPGIQPKRSSSTIGTELSIKNDGNIPILTSSSYGEESEMNVDNEISKYVKGVQGKGSFSNGDKQQNLHTDNSSPSQVEGSDNTLGNGISNNTPDGSGKELSSNGDNLQSIENPNNISSLGSSSQVEQPENNVANEISKYAKGVHKKESSSLNSSLSSSLDLFKVDWTNENLTNREVLRQGPGEQGTPVYINATEQKHASALLKTNGFNAFVSDKISVRRAIRDLRTTKCKLLKYDMNLPKVSIIVPFYNSHWSTLLRTIHSLVTRSPSSLIEEIILVDDFSTKTFLGKPLDRYVSETFSNVKILRKNMTEGLIKARLFGAKDASGEVLIFMDSHCEVGVNWLPPLLEPIKSNYRTVTCPFIDIIHNDNFSIFPQDDGARGAFDWNLDYKRLPKLPKDQSDPERPFESPVMAGDIFAISSKWFWELGGYDDGLKYWGGEQFELSFKIWMCGGHMIEVPCARIGHLRRKFNIFNVPALNDNIVKNYKRVAEVWMGFWKTFVYSKHPQRYEIECGNLTEQLTIKQNLECKSFDWFMETISSDILHYFPVSKPQAVSVGRIMSYGNPTICIDTKFGNEGDKVKIYKCVPESGSIQSGEQNLHFTWGNNIHPNTRSVCFDFHGDGKLLLLRNCKLDRSSQNWDYDPRSKRIFHLDSQKCIEMRLRGFDVFVNKCSSSINQKWTLENLNKEAVNRSIFKMLP